MRRVLREELLVAKRFPASISDLAFRFNPALAAGVTLNGADVSAIADLSGNARDASQATGTAQPLYDIQALNARNAITFTGANNDALSLANALGMTNAVPGFCVAAVLRQAAFTSGSTIFTAVTNLGGSRFSITVTSTGQLSLTTRRLDADTADTKTSLAVMAVGVASFLLAQVDYATGAVTLVIDGTPRIQTAAWAAGAVSQATNSSTAPVIGRTGANLLTGNVGEMVGYSRALSQGEINRLRTYMKPTWALAA